VASESSGRASQAKGVANERAIKRFFELCGCVVYQTGAPGIPKGKHGHRGTMRTPGLPDFVVLTPNGHLIFFEAKAGGAKLTLEQARFRTLVAFVETPPTFAWGDLAMAQQILQRLDVVTVDVTGAVARRRIPQQVDIGGLDACPVCAAPWRLPDGYTRLIGIEIQGGYDGVSEWQCPECLVLWNRWTNARVFPAP
jgi:hypothetical protein